MASFKEFMKWLVTPVGGRKTIGETWADLKEEAKKDFQKKKRSPGKMKTAISYAFSETALDDKLSEWDMGKVVWRGSEARMVGLCYEDAAGNESTRTVAVKAVTINFDEMRAFLHAFCLDKGELRSFRVDRVKDIFDEHGEILDKKKFLQEVGIKKPGAFDF